jgi:hypothetical protein
LLPLMRGLGAISCAVRPGVKPRQAAKYSERMSMSAKRRIAPLIGLTLRLEGRCACGSDLAKIVTGTGEHLTNLQCVSCGANRGHLSRTALTFVADAIADGRPKTPINLRRDSEHAERGACRWP